MEAQGVVMEDLARPIGENVATHLRKNSEWAFEAMERAKLGLHSQTLFGDRMGHFRDEKVFLAESFALLERCKYLAEERGKHVVLLIDSGTTLYPLFKLIGLATAQAYRNNERWITSGTPNLPPQERSKLSLITNNLPGAISLMEAGRAQPSRYSDLAISCWLLPGAPLPVYSAVAGPATEEALKRLKDGLGDPSNAAIISVVTGNWVRIRRTDPRCPVPLSRGKNHTRFKQVLVGQTLKDAPDEVYVITPLGKIFANASTREVNDQLDFHAGATDPDRDEYEELKINSEMARRVKLVCTARAGDRQLRSLSDYLQGRLLDVSTTVDPHAFREAKLGETPHSMFLFDRLPDERGLEIETEFPHPHTRRPDFINFLSNPN